MPAADAVDGGRSVAELHAAVAGLREEVVQDGTEIMDGWRPRIRRLEYLASAENLARYVALRRRDLRQLQLDLMPWGLSSLGRCEAHVLESLNAVEATLARLCGASAAAPAHPSFSEYHRGQCLLRAHSEAALGPTPAHREVRIMATLPLGAATDYGLVRELVARGMDIARINCAHDDHDAWVAMAAHVRRAAAETGSSCRVHMDLCGPRARTGVVVGGGEPRLRAGDRLLLTSDGGPAGDGAPQAVCSVPEGVEQLEVGHTVWIDEGRVGAVVEEKPGRGVALLRITEAPGKGFRLRANKGLNFPDIELDINPLTAKDLADLDVVVTLADMIGYSFVQRASDVALLQAELAKRLPQPGSVPLVAKIETAAAVRDLPELIVQGAGVQPFTVMIARGDLAVEIGHRRLAEIQEELLWLCEAGHVPAIWATQVLDGFVKKGRRSRAEATDAAMAERAECVMLNKGAFAGDAITFLDDVLGRMEGHQYKKAARMRELHSW